MKKSILTFVCAVLVIAFFGFVVLNGVNLGFYELPSITNTEDGVRLGLDLVGGSIITYEADVDAAKMSASTLDKDMKIVMDMLRQRLDKEGLFEAQVYMAGDNRVTVEIPALSDPEEAVQALGSTAQLQFLDDDQNVILQGDQVKNATAEFGPIDNTGISQNYVTLELTEEGDKLFTEATKKAAASTDGKNHINIMMDGESISSPVVGSQYATTGITGGKVMITGQFTAEQAGRLANNISVGQLPFGLKQVELRSVGAQLGMTALTSSITAGFIGICLVMLFMIAVYRLPGLVASVALLFYCVLMSLILVIFRINLSLPGIAGIILSIGMAVDANVVIFERIKEELRAGKTIKSAIDSGFHRAFSAILDSNITTLIAAVVLFFYGKGTIVGFAITLGLGIVLSMITALTVTRLLLNSLVGMKVTNIKFYGARERRDA